MLVGARRCAVPRPPPLGQGPGDSRRILQPPPTHPAADSNGNKETDMTRPITLILAALALAIAVPAAAQEGTLKKIRDGGSITIGHRDASIPFSYYDDKQQPVGYAMDLCLPIADAVKTELKLPKLQGSYPLVTSANRIPLMSNRTINLEGGSPPT